MKKGFNQKRKFLFIFAIFVFAFSFLFFFVRLPTTGNFVKYGSGPYVYNCSSNCSDCNDAIANASAGDIIYLDQSINAGGNSCINITYKNNIIFDCNNNAIVGSSGTGVFLISSSNSQIRNCNFFGFTYGAYLYYSNNNTLTDITASNNAIGIFYGESFNSTLTTSHIELNDEYGLYLYNAYFNLIYNNSFNNTNNYYIYSSGPFFSYFNTSKTSATNIIGKSYSGGNFWATPTGTGFSQNCTADVNNDKICDYLYYFNGGTDYLPLIYNTVNVTNVTCTENWTCANWTLCNASGIKTRICTDSRGCGTNITRPALNSTCTYSSNCTENWSCTNWTLCNVSGIKTKNCTDTNHCGTNITRPALNSTCTYSSNCTESWTCTAWSSCNANRIQTRTCTETNSCGTTASRPSLNQTCTYSTNATTGDTGASPTEGIGTNVTKNVTTITPTTPAVITINDSQIYLTKITLNVLESIQSASVTVTKVNVLSNATLAMGLPSGQFYQAFKIETAGVTDSNIANVTIEFKVNKLWLASKNGTVSGIGLYRRPDTSSEWNSLVTSLTSQDSTYYYFTSVSPGFSTFAVFFKACEGSECGTSSSPSALIYVLIAVVGIAIIITFFVLIKKMKKKETVVKKI